MKPFTYVGFKAGPSPTYWLVLTLRIATPLLGVARKSNAEVNQRDGANVNNAKAETSK
jgi:hypothetical protein